MRKIEGGVNRSGDTKKFDKSRSIANGKDVATLTLKEQQEYQLETNENVRLTEVTEKVLVVHFVKMDPGLPWASVIKGHPEIDVRTLKFNDNLYFTLANESL